jgi:hypothetical protein
VKPFWADSLGGPDDYDVNIRWAMASVGRKGGGKGQEEEVGRSEASF